ncbi:MAG: hypothetical protein QUV07_15260 [Cyanobium sp. CZS 25K]|nr:hypothetical protein [Cyanobium sp. CZS25K]
MSDANTDPPGGPSGPGDRPGRPAEPPAEPPLEPPAAVVGPLPELPSLGPLHLSLSADGLLLLGVAGWLLWRSVLHDTVMGRIGALLGTQQDGRYMADLLAQVAVLTGASRVVLGSFYSPSLTVYGYAFSRVTIVSSYVSLGRLPLALETKDLPIERIRQDLEVLIAHGVDTWHLVRLSSLLPVPCQDYLQRNGISFLYGRLIMLEGTPIGIINIHFDTPLAAAEDPPELPHGELLEAIYRELSRLVRGRMLRPSLFRRLFNVWAGR